jgi:hypothetical protein
MRAKRTVAKLNEIERTVRSAGKEIEGKVQKFLAKDGPAEKLAGEVDRLADEAAKDIQKLADKWAKKLQAVAKKARK